MTALAFEHVSHAFGDLVAVLDEWGPCDGGPADLNQDGRVDWEDIVLVLAGWGACG